MIYVVPVSAKCSSLRYSILPGVPKVNDSSLKTSETLSFAMFWMIPVINEVWYVPIISANALLPSNALPLLRIFTELIVYVYSLSDRVRLLARNRIRQEA